MTRHARYGRTEKGRARNARYRRTEKGRAATRRAILAQTTKRREAQIQRLEEALG